MVEDPTRQHILGEDGDGGRDGLAGVVIEASYCRVPKMFGGKGSYLKCCPRVSKTRHEALSSNKLWYKFFHRHTDRSDPFDMRICFKEFLT